MSKILFLLLALSLHSHSAIAEDPPIDRLKIFPGYKISVFAANVKNARSLTLGNDGVVFVGSRAEGAVYALLPDKNGDGKSDGVKVIAKGLNSPNGVAFKNGDLYIAEVSRLSVIKGVAAKLNSENKPEAWGPAFPTDEHHGWKFIAFGPDGWLYVPVGAPCNNCIENPELYAAIHRVSPDGKKRELMAKGVRNTVGFDWHPITKNLWFTENGRDWMGDEIPACELNELKAKGAHFGFPHCHAGELDPEFGKGKKCSDYVAPEHKFPAHSAPLGMRFLIKQKKFKNAILVAEHGSWNRSQPIGYQLTLIEQQADRKMKAQPFATGFLRGSSAWGRPVDVLELNDGSILVSDDKADAVYRIKAD